MTLPVDNAKAGPGAGNNKPEVSRRPVLMFQGLDLRWVYKPKLPILLPELALVTEFLLFSQAVAMKTAPPELLDEFWLKHMNRRAKRHFLVAEKPGIHLLTAGGTEQAAKYQRGA